MDAKQSLGQRMVEAARLAVMMHLQQSATDQIESIRQIAIGGTGPVVGGADRAFRDEPLPKSLEAWSRRATGGPR
jgi:hypothetical protein